VLWIALFLPELPLQLGTRASKEVRPCVIADGPATRPVVRCANPAARDRGVEPGMPVAAARALAGELVVLPRDEAAEAQALHNLGCWAYQFTPGIVIQPAEGLVLEVASTLNLHGGLTRLLGSVRQGIAELGYHAEPGVAPTPRAAWLLAKARHAGLAARMCTDLAALPERLNALPLALLDWPDDVTTPLQSLGVRRIGQCLKLPRDGFIRRFGHKHQLDLDQAIGAVLDPRPSFTPPDTFAARAEFGFEVTDALALLFPLRRLLQELEGFLRGRGAGVQQWHLLLEHMNHGRTTITMGVVAPERSAERFLTLARERLTRTTLMAPVLALGIAADQLLAFEARNHSLIPDPRTQAIGWGHLVDKLTARLGADKVYCLRVLDGHRPERGFQSIGAASAKTKPIAPPRKPRPLWLLRAPRTLLTQDGDPVCQGRLHFLAGPERIESGWWDGAPAHRDYYVARNPRGETFWIYHEHRHANTWYLHGIFA
jgi:protein ImuB